MIHCPHCRTILPESVQFCSRCGEPIGAFYKSTLAQGRDLMWVYAIVVPAVFAVVGSFFGKYFAVLGFIVGWLLLSVL